MDYTGSIAFRSRSQRMVLREKCWTFNELLDNCLTKFSLPNAVRLLYYKYRKEKTLCLGLEPSPARTATNKVTTNANALNSRSVSKTNTLALYLWLKSPKKRATNTMLNGMPSVLKPSVRSISSVPRLTLLLARKSPTRQRKLNA